MVPRYDQNVFFRVKEASPRNNRSTLYDFTRHYNISTPNLPVINNDTYKSAITFYDGGQAEYEQRKQKYKEQNHRRAKSSQTFESTVGNIIANDDVKQQEVLRRQQEFKRQRPRSVMDSANVLQQYNDDIIDRSQTRSNSCNSYRVNIESQPGVFKFDGNTSQRRREDNQQSMSTKTSPTLQSQLFSQEKQTYGLKDFVEQMRIQNMAQPAQVNKPSETFHNIFLHNYQEKGEVEDEGEKSGKGSPVVQYQITNPKYLRDAKHQQRTFLNYGALQQDPPKQLHVEVKKKYRAHGKAAMFGCEENKNAQEAKPASNVVRFFPSQQQSQQQQPKTQGETSAFQRKIKDVYGVRANQRKKEMLAPVIRKGRPEQVAQAAKQQSGRNQLLSTLKVLGQPATDESSKTQQSTQKGQKLTKRKPVVRQVHHGRYFQQPSPHPPAQSKVLRQQHLASYRLV